VEEDAEEGYTLFWRKESPFSQHHPANIVIDEITYNCAEQYMMRQKAGQHLVHFLLLIYEWYYGSESYASKPFKPSFFFMTYMYFASLFFLVIDSVIP